MTAATANVTAAAADATDAAVVGMETVLTVGMAMGIGIVRYQGMEMVLADVMSGRWTSQRREKQCRRSFRPK